MSAGKTLQLLSVAHNYRERGMAVVIFTAKIDSRSGEGCVSSRIGVSASARVFDPGTVFTRELVGEVACVLVDESQFLLPEQVRQLHRLANQQGGVPVMCFGLRTDFQGVPFPGAAMLLALAEDIEEVKTICSCGKRKATMNIRLGAGGDRVREGAQIEIGGNERYASVCATCFYADGS